MSNICGIVTGGKFSALKDIEKCNYIIACDKGYQYCKDGGIKPDLLIGDFDSYTGEIAEDLKVIKLPVAKDDTDTMYAIKKAIEIGFEEIWLYCALGNRFDHAFANIQACSYAAKRGLIARIIDEENYMIVSDSKEIRIAKKEGYSLSVFALDKCSNVNISGTKYEAENLDISNEFPIGQSNDWNSQEAIIKVEKGTFLVICSKMMEERVIME